MVPGFVPDNWAQVHRPHFVSFFQSSATLLGIKGSGPIVVDPETGEVWHTAVAMRTDHDDTETGHWVASWTSQDNGETEYAAHPAEWFTDWSPEAVA